jgi:hypothetical protein
MRLILENVFLLCRDCHDWYDGREWNHNFDDSEAFARGAIPPERYAFLQQLLQHPQPVNRQADEVRLRQQIQDLKRFRF